MMKIYRVEDWNGFGYKGERGNSEYKNLDYLTMIITKDQNTNSNFYKGHYRPVPWEDNIPKTLIKKDWLFGFESTDALKRWFSPTDLTIGSFLGGKVVVYETKKNVWCGKNQIVFHAPSAKVIDIVPMDRYTDDIDLCDVIDFDELKECFDEGEFDGHPEKDRIEMFLLRNSSVV